MLYYSTLKVVFENIWDSTPSQSNFLLIVQMVTDICSDINVFDIYDKTFSDCDTAVNASVQDTVKLTVEFNEYRSLTR